MTPKQYKNLQDQATEYDSSLNLDVVKYELNGNLLIQNTKLSKGDGLPNYGLEMIPSNFVAGRNYCEKAGSCKLTCIFFSGVANTMQSKTGNLSAVLKKRIRRQYWFHHDSTGFIAALNREILALSVINQGGIAVRLNVVQDIDWLSYGVNFQVPGVKFYDYTKVLNRGNHVNHHITYSASERDSDRYLIKLLSNGLNVAMVFPGKTLPDNWQGFEVINGDEHDRRYQDKSGVIIGLIQKTTQHGKTDSAFISRSTRRKIKVSGYVTKKGIVVKSYYRLAA